MHWTNQLEPFFSSFCFNKCLLSTCSYVKEWQWLLADWQSKYITENDCWHQNEARLSNILLYWTASLSLHDVSVGSWRGLSECVVKQDVKRPATAAHFSSSNPNVWSQQKRNFLTVSLVYKELCKRIVYEWIFGPPKLFRTKCYKRNYYKCKYLVAPMFLCVLSFTNYSHFFSA